MGSRQPTRERRDLLGSFRPLGFEPLEDRRLLAVTASVSGGVLTVDLNAAADSATIAAATVASGGAQEFDVNGSLVSSGATASSVVVNYLSSNQSATFNGSTAIAISGALAVSDTGNSTGESLTFANATAYSFGSVGIWTSETASVGTLSVNDSLAASAGTLTIGTGTASTSPVWSPGSATGTISAAGGDIDISANTTLTIATAISDPTGTVRLVSGTGTSESSTITAAIFSGSAASGTIVLEGANAVTGSFAFSAPSGVTFNNGTTAATVGAVSSSTPFASVTGITTTNSDVNLAGAGLAINDSVSVGTGSVRLVEAGDISQGASGAITALGLSVANSAGSDVLETANTIANLAVNNTTSPDPITLNNGATALTVTTIAAAANTLDPSGLFGSVTGVTTNSGDLNLEAKTLAIDQVIGAGTGAVRFVTAGGISQTSPGSITAAALSTSNSSGNVVLELVNDVGTLAASNSATSGVLTFYNGTNPLTIGSVAAGNETEDPNGLFAAVTGIGTANGDVNLKTPSVAIDQAVDTGTGSLRLVLSITATQAASGTITASSMSIYMTGSANSVVLESANAVSTLATEMSGTLTFNDGNNSLTAGAVAAPSTTVDPSFLFRSVSGIYANGGTTYGINLISGGLSITEGIDAGIVNDVRLVESGSVTQANTVAGEIGADALSITTTSGNVILENSGNFGAPELAMSDTSPSGAIEFNNGGTTAMIGSIPALSSTYDPNGLFGAVSGIATNNGDVGINTGTLTISNAISAGTGNVRLVVSVAISEAAAITAGGLSVSGTAKAVLELSNAVGTFAASSATSSDPVSFSNGSNPLTIGSFAAESSTVDPSGLFGAVSGITTDNSDVDLESGGLSVNLPINAGTGTVRLVESGAVTQAASTTITAAGLSITSSGGGATLLPTNAFSTLAANYTGSGNPFNFDTDSALTIGTISAAGSTADPSGLFPAVAGISSGGSAISVASVGTNTALTVDSNVVSAGGSITLQATGNVTIGTGVTINGSTAPLTLAADVTASGTGDDGVGTLTISSGATVVTSGTITLRGAAESIATGSDPAVVGASMSSQSTTPTATLTGLNGPEWMIFDTSGYLYVGNYGAGNGTTVSVFAPGATTPTSTLTGLDGPTAMAFGSNGDLYVANAAGNSISVFTPGSTTPSSTLTGVTNPTAMAFYGGSLYVANSNGVSVFASGSTTPTSTLTPPNGAFRLAFDSYGNLFVSNNGTTMYEFAPGSTTPTATLTGVNYPRGLGFDSSGNLYVTNNAGGSGTTVSVFAPGGTSPTTTLTGLSGPSSLAFDSNGNLYVGNNAANTISEFAPGSTTPTTTFTGLSHPDHLIFGPTGILYAANLIGNTVSEFSPPRVTSAATGLVIQSSVESRPMLIGGTNNNPVAGINLTSAELTQIFTTSAGTVTIGDAQQTGNITFAGATPTTLRASLNVVQSTSGSGQIILQESTSGGTALDVNAGTVTLTPGTGGIQADAVSSTIALTTYGFTASAPLSLALGFAPTVGTQLTIVNNSAPPVESNLIGGAFSNLPQGGTLTASYLGTTYTFQANYEGGDGNDLVLTETASSGPTVIGAFVSNTNWSLTYLALLDSAGLGSSEANRQGFELASGGNQLTTTLPWTNVNQISIAFGEPVNVSQTSLTLYNSANTALYPSGFYYNYNTNIATWQFATSLAASKYLINLAAASVTDSNGNALDGAWTTSVSTFAAGSGNGTPGSDFNFYFNVLPGDASGDGQVNGTDLLFMKLDAGSQTTASNYRYDLQGSGTISSSYILTEKLNAGMNTSMYSTPNEPAESMAQIASPTTTAQQPEALTADSSALASSQTPAPSGLGSGPSISLPSVLADTETAAPETDYESNSTLVPVSSMVLAAPNSPAVSLPSSTDAALAASVSTLTTVSTAAPAAVKLALPLTVAADSAATGSAASTAPSTTASSTSSLPALSAVFGLMGDQAGLPAMVDAAVATTADSAWSPSARSDGRAASLPGAPAAALASKSLARTREDLEGSSAETSSTLDLAFDRW